MSEEPCFNNPAPQRIHKRKKVSPELRLKIYERDGYRCQICDKDLSQGQTGKDMVLDHKIPLSKGGSNANSNLWLLCRRCDAIKGNSIINSVLIQFLQRKLEIARYYKCLCNDENKICEVGLIYSTKYPPNRHAGKDFWIYSVTIFAHEFQEVKRHEFINATKRPRAPKPQNTPKQQEPYPRFLLYVGKQSRDGIFIENKKYDTAKDFSPDLWAKVWSSRPENFVSIKQWEYELDNPSEWQKRLTN